MCSSSAYGNVIARVSVRVGPSRNGPAPAASPVVFGTHRWPPTKTIDARSFSRARRGRGISSVGFRSMRHPRNPSWSRAETSGPSGRGLRVPCIVRFRTNQRSKRKEKETKRKRVCVCACVSRRHPWSIRRKKSFLCLFVSFRFAVLCCAVLFFAYRSAHTFPSWSKLWRLDRTESSGDRAACTWKKATEAAEMSRGTKSKRVSTQPVEDTGVRRKRERPSAQTQDPPARVSNKGDAVVLQRFHARRPVVERPGDAGQDPGAAPLLRAGPVFYQPEQLVDFREREVGVSQGHQVHRFGLAAPGVVALVQQIEGFSKPVGRALRLRRSRDQHLLSNSCRP